MVRPPFSPHATSVTRTTMPPLRRLLATLCLGLALITALPCPGRAQDTPDPFTGLASESFDDIATAIGVLAVSGNAQALATITALQNEALFVSPEQAILIKDGDAFIDARTGQKVADVSEDDLTPVRVNNAVRRAIDAAKGGLDLVSPDAAVRAHAAEDVFKSRDPATLPLLARVIAQEKVASVKQVMLQAQAADLLTANTGAEADQLAAVAVLLARGDIEAKSLLGSLHDSPPAVAAAAAAAIASMERMERIWSLAQGMFYGVSLGSVLLLAAAGLAITFGVMGVINMAHGEMVMLGAYTTYTVQEVIADVAPSWQSASLLLSVPLAFLVAGLVGVLIERCLIRFLYGRPLETLLATWGLSLVLQQAIRSLFGSSNRDVLTPWWMSGATQLGGITITYNRLYIIVFAAIVLAALMAVLRYTALGLRMRAVTQNRRMAAAMGIRTPWIDALTFGLGSGVAGMAGVALSQVDNVSPNLGQSYIIDSFMVVVFGGVGNLWGTVVSALTLGIVNKFLEPVAGAVLGKIVVLVALILFIQRKPRGMFPLKGRAVEQ
jgi:urea transport system permease protein